MMQEYHIPVLLKEAVEGLDIKGGGTYVDVTFGGGGHSREILKRLESGRLLVFDQDPAAEKNLPEEERVTFVNHNFRFLKRFLRFYEAVPVDGILADLGVSSHQFDTGERGFSTRLEGALDMRMDTAQQKSARDVVNEYPQEDLEQIFREYGEVPNPRQLARVLVEERQLAEITTTEALVAIAERVMKGKRSQYLAQVFQAIRIEVNEEMDALKEMLEQSAEVLKPGGRFVVISYHSLEDRLVKNFFKRGGFGEELVKDFYGNPLRPFKEINKKPITPNKEEILKNPRSRSAKMRIAEKA